MATAQLPSAATLRAAAIRDGLADVRRRTANLEALATWSVSRRRASLLDRILDQAIPSGRPIPSRRRRPDRRLPVLAAVVGILAGIGIVAVLASIVLRRRAAMNAGAGEIDDETPLRPSEIHGETSRDGKVPAADAAAAAAAARADARADAFAREDADAASFPASDPMPTAMSPGIGAD
jgi:hypothetical protein